MIKVIVGSNTTRKTVLVPSTMTIRQILEDNGINYSVGQTNVDGCVLQPGDMDKSLADLGITTQCYVMNVAKHDNA